MELHHQRSHQPQAILSLLIYIVVYMALTVLSWLYTGAGYIHFFIEDNIRILQKSVLLLAIWRFSFISDYDLMKFIRSLLIGLYLLCLSNVITQCFRYTSTSMVIYVLDFGTIQMEITLTHVKITVILIPLLLHFYKQMRSYIKEQESIFKN